MKVSEIAKFDRITYYKMKIMWPCKVCKFYIFFYMAKVNICHAVYYSIDNPKDTMSFGLSMIIGNTNNDFRIIIKVYKILNFVFARLYYPYFTIFYEKTLQFYQFWCALQLWCWFFISVCVNINLEKHRGLWRQVWVKNERHFVSEYN